MKRDLTFQSILVLAIVSASILIGCGTVTETVYLNDLSVRGPIAQPPVHLTNDPTEGEFHFSPKVSVAPKTSLDTRIAGNAYPQYYGVTRGNNFHWSIPAAQFGADCDWMLSDKLALSFGANYASMPLTQLWGGYGGIGFPFDGKTVSGRFDVGLQFQGMWYDAYSVVVTEYSSAFSRDKSTTVSYFHDINTSTPYNLYTALTLNTHFGSSIDFFASASVSWQTLTDFQPSSIDDNGPIVDYHYTDARAEQTATMIIFTPGLVFTLGPSMKLLTGARIMYPAGLSDSLPLLVAPMLQVDMTL